MKAFKVLLASVALGAAFATASFAADEKAPGEGRKAGRGMMNPEQRVEQLDKELTLTADQKTKILAILTKSREQVQAIPQEERREKGRELMQQANQDVRAVLTAEQQKKFDEMRPGRGEGQGGKKKKDQN